MAIVPIFVDDPMYKETGTQQQSYKVTIFVLGWPALPIITKKTLARNYTYSGYRLSRILYILTIYTCYHYSAFIHIDAFHSPST